MSNGRRGSPAALALAQLVETRERKHEIRRALMGDGQGNVIYPAIPNYVYIRLLSDTSLLHIARNLSLPLMDNLPCNVQVHSENSRIEYVVIGLAGGLPAQVWPVQEVPQHAYSHERRWDGSGGWDAVDVYPRMFFNLRARAQIPAALTVYVERGYYYINDTLYEFTGGSSGTFTADGESYDALSINAAGTLSITAGVHVMTGVPLFPALPAGELAVAAIRVSNGMTTITEDELLADIRPLLSIGSGTSVIASQANRRSWMGI